MLARTVLDRLTKTYSANSDAANATAMRAYMRDQFPFLGITSKTRTELDREILAGVDKPSERDLVAIARQ